MGIIVLHDRVYGRREITSATASTTATAATSSPSVPVTQPLPTSVKALAGFIVVLGLVVLGAQRYLVRTQFSNLPNRHRRLEDWQMAPK